MVLMRGQKVGANVYKLTGSTIVGGAAAITESEHVDMLL
jgi:hypothetical protein